MKKDTIGLFLDTSSPKAELTKTAQTVLSYAEQVNEKFQSSADTIVELVDRFEQAFNEDEVEFLQSMRQEFQDRNPQYQKFEDMYADMVQMPADKIERVQLKDMLINATIQREVMADWVIEIVGKFDPFFVNIVRLYPLLNRKDRKRAFAIWDGQHTTFALLCIALYVFNMSMEEALELEIPTAIYPGRDIAKLRKRFIGVHDDTMTKPLAKIDLYMQYVWAVRNNGDKDPWSMRFEEIQTSLEEFGCFFTDKKFGDTDQPGAISRPTEIFPKGRDVSKWKSSVLRQVFQYHSISNPDRPVEPLEIDNMAHIFRACDQQGIAVDDNYIRKFVKYLGAVTGNKWQKGYTKAHRKHVMVMQAYKSWLKRQHYRVREQFDTRCNQTEVAPTWICQAIEQAGFDLELPVFTGKYSYTFDQKELGA